MPGIAHGQLEIGSGLQDRDQSGFFDSHIDLGQGDFQHPAFLAHGVAGIDAQIHEHLMNLGRVGH